MNTDQAVVVRDHSSPHHTPRRGLARRALLLPAALLLVGAVSTADDPPPPMGQPYLLPVDMVADFGEKRFTNNFELQATGSGTVDVYPSFSTEGPGGVVRLKTIYSGATSYGTARVDSFGTTFEPTAVTHGSKRTDRLYVAGWRPRAREAVIEEWTFRPVTIDEELSALGDGPHPTLSEYRFTRREVFAGAGPRSAPIEAIACDAANDRLLVLEYGPQARLSSLDLTLDELEEPTLVELADGASMPELLATRSLSAGFHVDHGLVIVLRPVRAWQAVVLDTIVALYDVDGDGQLDFDDPQTMSRAEWVQRFPTQGWSSDV